MYSKIKNFLIPLVILTFFWSNQSCTSTKKVTYFSKLKDTTISNTYPVPELFIRPNDVLSITVSSLNPEASAMFNSPNTSNASEGSPGGKSEYLVNREGYIQFPVLGNIKAADLTEEELRRKITKELSDRKLLVDPIVSIRQVNFKVTVLGEVGDPGVIPVRNEKISLLEAIGLAGDLTIYARRNNVLLIREKPNGDKLIRRLNLNSNNLFLSPYYYLKNNDVIYVEPNRTKVASTGRSQIILPIVFSGLSLLIITFSTWLK